MAALSATEREVWSVWNLLSDNDPAPVKRIARFLGMEPADVAFIVYPAETFGRWDDSQEPDLPAVGKYGLFDTEAERDAYVTERDRQIAEDAFRYKDIGIKDAADFVSKYSALCDLFERIRQGADLTPGCDDPLMTSDLARAAANRVLEIMQGG